MLSKEIVHFAQKSENCKKNKRKEKKMNISKKVFALILTTAILTTALVSASVIQQIPIQHNVLVTGIYKFTIYQDEACTTELTSLNWTVCRNGLPHYKTIYAKNTGNELMSISWNSTNTPSGVTLTMTLSGTSFPQNTILGLGPANVKRDIQLSLSIDPSVPLGALTFTTIFYGHDGA